MDDPGGIRGRFGSKDEEGRGFCVRCFEVVLDKAGGSGEIEIGGREG